MGDYVIKFKSVVLFLIPCGPQKAFKHYIWYCIFKEKKILQVFGHFNLYPIAHPQLFGISFFFSEV